MKKEYIKIAAIPEEEKIVSTVVYGGFWYWSYRFPFRHYKTRRWLVATERGLYEIEVN